MFCQHCGKPINSDINSPDFCVWVSLDIRANRKNEVDLRPYSIHMHFDCFEEVAGPDYIEIFRQRIQVDVDKELKYQELKKGTTK